MTDEELIERLREIADMLFEDAPVRSMQVDAAASTIARLIAALDEDALEEAISDSLDVDWHPRDAARVIRQRAGLEGDVP